MTSAPPALNGLPRVTEQGPSLITPRCRFNYGVSGAMPAKIPLGDATQRKRASPSRFKGRRPCDNANKNADK